MIDSCTLTSMPMLLSGTGRPLRGKGIRRGRTASDLLPEISVTEIKHVNHDHRHHHHHHHHHQYHQHPPPHHPPSHPHHHQQQHIMSPTHSTKTTASNGSGSHSSIHTPTRVHLISCRDVAPELSRVVPNSHHSLSIHDEVLNTLQDDFSVRISNRNRRRSQTSLTLETQLSRSPHQLSIAKANVCVYLFTNATIQDANCFHDLCSAVALKIPVIFVRGFGSELPKNFSDFIRRNSHGCLSLTEYIEKYLMDNNDGGRESPKQNGQVRKTIRQNNRLAPLSVRSRPTPASDLNVRGVDVRKGRRRTPPEDDTDLLLYLVSSFQSALVYDDRIRSSLMLKQCIHQSVSTPENGNVMESSESGYENTVYSLPDSSELKQTHDNNDTLMYSTETGNSNSDRRNDQTLLRVPESEIMISTREWGSSRSVSVPTKTTTTSHNNNPSKDGRYSYDIRMVSPLPVAEKETTYLIFQDKRSPDGIRMVNFPVDEDELREHCDESDTADELDPRNSPIHITDIDLAREINKSIDTPDSDL